MIYLASPYSHTDPKIEEIRYIQACRMAGKMMKDGIHVYSPVASCRPISVMNNLPHDFAYWAGYDTEMISLCSEVVVLTLKGWEESKGVQAEISIAHAIGKPVRYINYNIIAIDKETILAASAPLVDAGL